ncbi:MAG TPA: hypothetical protein VFF65_13050 [Phycisphaerales bacterium]|nr:hypothetical protein [Phycisphaerales bacterium]
MLLLALCLWRPAEASAQWTQPNGGGHINSTNTGNVGIGTATPATKLEVGGQADNLFRVVSTGSGATDTVAYFASNVGGIMMVRANGNVGIGTTSPAGRLHMAYGTNAWYFLGGDSQNNKGLNAGASWSTANGTQLTFNAYGGGTELITELGPNYAIHGGTGVHRYAMIGGKKAPVIQMSADAGSISLFGESGSGTDWRTPTLNLGLHVSAGGSVGVGTSSPARKLDVSVTTTGGHQGMALTNTNGRSWWLEAADSTGNGASANGVPANGFAVIDWTAGQTRLAIDGAGNVGVGVTSPAYRLDVAGSVNASGLCLGGTCKGTWSEIAGSGGGSGWTVAGATVGLSNTSASVGIGPTGPNGPRGKLEVAGGSLFLGDMGNAGWGDAVIRGRVISASHNFHISPPGGRGVYIDSDYREAGGEPGPVDLHVSGDVIAGGNISAKYQDVAEWVPSTQKLAPGTVVVLDSGRTNHVLASSSAYDTKVAGVVSEMPGVILGEGGEGKLMVATTGRVKVRVDATRAAIRIGDLLVTGDAEGVAMRSEPVTLGARQFHAPGTIIGKALEPLEKGMGEILVLLSLQ